MPSLVPNARARDNHGLIAVPATPCAESHTATRQAYAVLLIRRIGGFTPSTAALYAGLAGLASEQA